MIVFCLQDPTVPGEQAHIHVHVLFGLGSAAYHCGETNFFHDCEIKSGEWPGDEASYVIRSRGPEDWYRNHRVSLFTKKHFCLELHYQ